MAKASKTAAVDPNAITGYCIKTKTKNVPIQECVVNKNGGRYMAKGHDDDGNVISSIVNGEKAEAAIAAGTATKGTGWEAEKPKKAKKA